MNVLIIIRLILVAIIVIVIDFLIKLNKAIKIERRVARYSIDSIMEYDNNLGDSIKNRYNHFLKRIRNIFK